MHNKRSAAPLRVLSASDEPSRRMSWMISSLVPAQNSLSQSMVVVRVLAAHRAVPPSPSCSPSSSSSSSSHSVAGGGIGWAGSACCKAPPFRCRKRKAAAAAAQHAPAQPRPRLLYATKTQHSYTPLLLQLHCCVCKVCTQSRPPSRPSHLHPAAARPGRLHQSRPPGLAAAARARRCCPRHPPRRPGRQPPRPRHPPAAPE